MKNTLEEKRSKLPQSPGVYLYKNKNEQTIYVGKASKLRNRVSQYFQKSRPFDSKTTALVADIFDLDYITVETEIDALFLEAELIRRYRPKYNILLRDDKSSSYIRIDIKSNHPTVTITRRPLDDKAEYFGPYYNASLIKSALRQLRRVFPYSTHSKNIPKRACLLYQIGLCPGLEEDKTDINEYRKNLKLLIQYIRGSRTKIVNEIEKDMKLAAKKSDFELAARLRNQLFAIKGLKNSIVFGREEFMDISSDRGLQGLTKILGLESHPKRIEGYDISHMSGTDTVASMVVFTNGLPDKSEYRKFKMRLPGNDDFAHMNETIFRRFSKRNVKSWSKPDLILIDGGKGQLSSAMKARNELGYREVPMIGLAKREEDIIVPNGYFFNLEIPIDAEVKRTKDFTSIHLGEKNDVVKLLQRVRDESHRFAVSYHSSLKRKRQTDSFLDNIPGVGAKTKSKLIRTLGSAKNVADASKEELTNIVGPKIADRIYLHKVESIKK